MSKLPSEFREAWQQIIDDYEKLPDGHPAKTETMALRVDQLKQYLGEFK